MKIHRSEKRNISKGYCLFPVINKSGRHIFYTSYWSISGVVIIRLLSVEAINYNTLTEHYTAAKYYNTIKNIPCTYISVFRLWFVYMSLLQVHIPDNFFLILASIYILHNTYTSCSHFNYSIIYLYDHTHFLSCLRCPLCSDSISEKSKATFNDKIVLVYFPWIFQENFCFMLYHPRRQTRMYFILTCHPVTRHICDVSKWRMYTNTSR